MTVLSLPLAAIRRGEWLGFVLVAWILLFLREAKTSGNKRLWQVNNV